MATPREILRHAAVQTTAERRPERPPEPVPAVTETPQRTAVPQPIRENTVYRQLMRSHDRVHTRHIRG